MKGNYILSATDVTEKVKVIITVEKYKNSEPPPELKEEEETDEFGFTKNDYEILKILACFGVAMVFIAACIWLGTFIEYGY